MGHLLSHYGDFTNIPYFREQVNYDIKCATNDKFSKNLYAEFFKTTKLNIPEHLSFPKSMNIGIHEN